MFPAIIKHPASVQNKAALVQQNERSKNLLHAELQAHAGTKAELAAKDRQLHIAHSTSEWERQEYENERTFYRHDLPRSIDAAAERAGQAHNDLHAHIADLNNTVQTESNALAVAVGDVDTRVEALDHSMQATQSDVIQLHNMAQGEFGALLPMRQRTVEMHADLKDTKKLAETIKKGTSHVLRDVRDNSTYSKGTRDEVHRIGAIVHTEIRAAGRGIDRRFGVIQQQTGAIGNKLDEQTRIVGGKLDQQASILSQQTGVVNSRLEEQSRVLGDRLDEQTQVVGDKLNQQAAILNQQTSVVNNKLEQQTGVIDSKLKEQMRVLESNITKQTGVIINNTNRQSTGFREALGTQTTSINKNLGEHTTTFKQALDAQTITVNEKFGAQAALFDQRLGEREKSIHNKLGEHTAAFKQALNAQATSVNEKFGTQATFIDKKLGEQTAALNNTLFFQTGALNKNLGAHTSTFERKIDAQSEALHQQFRGQTETLTEQLREQTENLTQQFHNGVDARTMYEENVRLKASVKELTTRRDADIRAMVGTLVNETVPQIIQTQIESRARKQEHFSRLFEVAQTSSLAQKDLAASVSELVEKTAQFGGKLDTINSGFHTFKMDLGSKLNTVDGKLNTINSGFHTFKVDINVKLNTIDGKLNTIDGKVNTIDGKVNTIDTGYHTMRTDLGGRLDTINSGFHTLKMDLDGKLNTITTGYHTMRMDLGASLKRGRDAGVQEARNVRQRGDSRVPGPEENPIDGYGDLNKIVVWNGESEIPFVDLHDSVKQALLVWSGNNPLGPTWYDIAQRRKKSCAARKSMHACLVTTDRNVACDRCVGGLSFCIRRRAEDDETLCLFPLLAQDRVGKAVTEVGFWVLASKKDRLRTTKALYHTMVRS